MSEKVIEELNKLKSDLNQIWNEASNGGDLRLGWEKIKRWKQRAVHIIGSMISKEEGQTLEEKHLGVFSMMDPMRNFRDEVHMYDSYLQSLIEEVKTNPDFIFKSESEKESVVTDYFIKLQKLLKSLHRVAQQLRSRHEDRPTLEIEDEYDVQDLLHALLKIEFDDIRPEEWTPSYAGGSLKMDFLLKKENCVIETKKTRKGLDEKEIGEQLLIDIEKYKEHPNCKTLVCFIYDPEGRIGNPRGLITDLENQSKNEIKVKVFIAPVS